MASDDGESVEMREQLQDLLKRRRLLLATLPCRWPCGGGRTTEGAAPLPDDPTTTPNRQSTVRLTPLSPRAIAEQLHQAAAAGSYWTVREILNRERAKNSSSQLLASRCENVSPSRPRPISDGSSGSRGPSRLSSSADASVSHLYQLIHQRDIYGQTVFHHVVRSQSIACFELLRKAASDTGTSLQRLLKQQDKAGTNPLGRCVQYTRETFGRRHATLLEAIAAQLPVFRDSPSQHADYADSGGNTLLHIAMRFDRPSVVRMLLGHGFSPLVTNNVQQTAFHVGYTYRAHASLRLLFRVHCFDDAKPSPLSSSTTAEQTIEQLGNSSGTDAALNAVLTSGTVLSRGSRDSLIAHDFTNGEAPRSIQLFNDCDTQSEPHPTIRYSEKPYDAMVRGTAFTFAADDRFGCACDTCVDGHCPCIQVNGQIPYKPNGSINRFDDTYFLFECGPTCACNARTCPNRVVQNVRHATARLELFKTTKKGWGLRTLQPLRRGQFICFMTGVVLHTDKANEDAMYTLELPSSQPLLDESLLAAARGAEGDGRDSAKPSSAMQRRNASRAKKKRHHKEFVIECLSYGNIGRFLNHACHPLDNAIILPVITGDCVVPSLPRMALFTERAVQPLEELTWNYSENYWKNGDFKMCKCGSATCITLKLRGHMSLDSDAEGDDDEEVRRRRRGRPRKLDDHDAQRLRRATLSDASSGDSDDAKRVEDGGDDSDGYRPEKRRTMAPKLSTKSSTSSGARKKKRKGRRRGKCF